MVGFFQRNFKKEADIAASLSMGYSTVPDDGSLTRDDLAFIAGQYGDVDITKVSGGTVRLAYIHDKRQASSGFWCVKLQRNQQDKFKLAVENWKKAKIARLSHTTNTPA